MSPDYRPPRRTPGDRLASGARDLIGLIPPVGGIAKFFMDSVLPLAFAERQEQWMEEVGEALGRLERRSMLDTHRLMNDPGFIDLIVQATLAAMRTRHTDKRKALARTVAHASVALDPDRDEELTFIRYVDELTPSHLEVLRFLRAKEEDFKNVESYQELYDRYSHHVVRQHASPVSRDRFRLICTDLAMRGLLRLSRDIQDFPGVREADIIVERDLDPTAPRLLVTELGHNFVRDIDYGR